MGRLILNTVPDRSGKKWLQVTSLESLIMKSTSHTPKNISKSRNPFSSVLRQSQAFKSLNDSLLPHAHLHWQLLFQGYFYSKTQRNLPIFPYVICKQVIHRAHDCYVTGPLHPEIQGTVTQSLWNRRQLKKLPIQAAHYNLF